MLKSKSNPLLILLVIGIIAIAKIVTVEGICCLGDCDGLVSCCGDGPGACNIFCCNCDGDRCGNGAFGRSLASSRMFSKIDTNKDHKLQSDEMKIFMNSKFGKNMTTKRSSMADFDLNGDGVITENEMDRPPKKG